MTTDPHQVLAAAMGKPMPQSPSSADNAVQSATVPAFLLEIFEHRALPDRYDSIVIRNVLLVCALVLSVCIVTLVRRARKNYLGYQQAPLALDYSIQRKQLARATS